MEIPSVSVFIPSCQKNYSDYSNYSACVEVGTGRFPWHWVYFRHDDLRDLWFILQDLRKLVCSVCSIKQLLK